MNLKVPYTTKSGDKFTIVYFEHTNSWQTEHDEVTVQAETLIKLKEKLDRRTSPKVKARKIPILTSGRYRGSKLVPGMATSRDGPSYVRVTYGKDNKRESVVNDKVYADTPKNREIAAQLEKLAKEEQVLQDKQSKLNEKLVPINLKLLDDD